MHASILSYIYNPMKTDMFLPIYAGLMVFILIVLLLFMDQNTPIVFVVILIIAYSAFIFFYLARAKGKKPTSNIHTLQQFKDSDQRAVKLTNFQKVSESILRDIRANRNQDNNQFAVRSSYPSHYSDIKSLQELSHARHQGEKYAEMFTHYNTGAWKQHFREALHLFSENLYYAKDCCSDPTTYKSALVKQSFDSINLEDAESLGRQFLMDRAKKHFTMIEPLIEEANSLMSKNFGMTFSKMESSRPNQIGLEEFKNVLRNYMQSFLLPKRFTPRQNNSLLQRDMFRLMGIMNEMNPLVVFPHPSFCSFLFIEILRKEFREIKIQVNESQDKGSYCIRLQYDFGMSWSHAPQFRTFNCNKALMVLLALLAKQNKLENRIIRTFRSFQI